MVKLIIKIQQRVNLENKKVKNDRLKQDLIKYLEKYLFGEDIEP